MNTTVNTVAMTVAVSHSTHLANVCCDTPPRAEQNSTYAVQGPPPQPTHPQPCGWSAAVPAHTGRQLPHLLCFRSRQRPQYFDCAHRPAVTLRPPHPRRMRGVAATVAAVRC